MTKDNSTVFKNWLVAIRPRTLPLAAANIAMGSALAYYFGRFSLLIFILTLSTALLLQVLSNLANDYGDFVNGADHKDREGPDRMVQSGAISEKSMLRAMIISSLLAFISGLSLLYFSSLSWSMIGLFLAFGIIAIWAAVNYTSGPKPYGYRALGDLSVFIFFGLLSVIGSYYLQMGELQWSIIYPAISCGVFSMAVLNINNIRDIKSDALSGKTSLAMLLGRDRASTYHLVLLTLGIAGGLIFTYLHFHSYWQLLFLITVPLLIKNFLAVKNKENAMDLDPFLKQMALTTLLFVITFSIGLLV